MAHYPSETPTRPARNLPVSQLLTPITPGQPFSFSSVNTPPPPLSFVAPTAPSSRNIFVTQKAVKKRKGKENDSPHPAKKTKAHGFLSPLQNDIRESLDIFEKLRLFHGFLATELNWKLGELFYYATLTAEQLQNLGIKTNDADFAHHYPFKASTKKARSASLQHFFNGRGIYTPSVIVNQWWKSPYGKRDRDSPDMFSMLIPHGQIKPVRPGISSFAAQIVAERLVQETRKAVRPSSGLHVSLSGRSRSAKVIEWPDIGSTTFSTSRAHQAHHQPLSRHLLVKIIDKSPESVFGTVVDARKRRPIDTVVTGVLSTLNYARTSNANLQPLAIGLLFLAMGAPFDLFRFCSRLGQMPSYSTVIKALRALAEHEASVTLAHGRSPDTLGFIWLDNVQNYILQRDPAIGRDNRLIIGIAATYYEIPVDDRMRNAFRIEEKAKSLAEGKRRTLTVQKLLGLIDTMHVELICALQWVRVLVHAIPQLHHLKAEVSRRYHIDAAKQRLPLAATKCHPLASSSRNETILTELKAAILDFLEQTGQTRDNFKGLLFAFGGDGLTFEKLKQLRVFLQCEPHLFDALKNVHPLLAWWHTEWTNLSRIVESHWGSTHGRDPSTLGHSAEKIGHKKPSNPKKVDFYISRDLVFDVLDARMLDCWRILLCTDGDLFEYFVELDNQKKLPSFDVLFEHGKKLYHAYTSLRAQTKVEIGRRSSLSSLIVDGDPWPENDTGSTFAGDQALMCSISFMRDAIFAREFSLATAEGDPGRIWEMIKIMVFTFAGSSHSKYTQYLLEMITDLEFESSPDLRRGLLSMTLVNLTGREGHWSAGDFIQEYFNRILETVVQRKGVDYGDAFVRRTWARNLANIGLLKISMLDGVGLDKRSSSHTGAKRLSERKILMDSYREAELHLFRAGRTYTTESYIDDFNKGVTALQGGKLKRWRDKTVRMQNVVNQTPLPEENSTGANEEEDDDEDDEDDDVEVIPVPRNIRFSAMVDDELIVESVDTMERTISAILEEDPDDSEAEEIDAEENHSSSSDEDDM